MASTKREQRRKFIGQGEQHDKGLGTGFDGSEPREHAQMRWSDIFRRRIPGWPEFSIATVRDWLSISAVVEHLGLPFDGYASDGSPGGNEPAQAWAYPFLDGGTVSPCAWPRRFQRLEGHACLRFICYELGLKPPRKLPDEEDEIPTHAELLEWIDAQRNDEDMRDALREEARRMVDRCFGY